MAKWEYIVIPATTDAHALNDLGADGWELVDTANGFMYFKKAKTTTRKRTTKAKK